MNYRSISDLNRTILEQLHRIPRDIDLIVGVPRSGMLPANLLALYLNLPYTDIHSFINGFVYKAGARRQFFETSEYQKILVVDDSVASGSAITESKESLAHLTSKFDFQYCAVYVVPEKENSVDFALETVATPRYFQWNIFNHSSLSKACFDIDGVLCVDPTEAQNDDGPNYKSFLLNAAPLYIPGSKIGTLVTSRLEKYRAETEIWLEKHGVKYEALVMLDLPNMKARQKANCHGSHKANTYRNSHHNLFVESDLKQAIAINKLTRKPVFCTENFKMIYDAESLTYNIKSGKYLPFLRATALRLRAGIQKLKTRKLVLR